MAPICRVLVVEDNDDIRQMLGEVLAYEGYRFATAANGAEMRLALATVDHIDVLVIDVTLPGGDDGLALACEMAEAGYAVIVVTGDHRQVERIERSGHRFILKPFRIAALLELVDRALRETAAKCRPPRRRA